jgi:DNA-binding NtrC family response regulator
MSKGRVLIVDDEPVVRESLRAWFESDDYEVCVAESGEMGLRSAHTTAYDVALVDIKMPGMDGLEFQERLREVDPDVVLIIMTGYGTVETAVRALKNGAYDYVTKPADPDHLSRLVTKGMDLRRARREAAGLRVHLSEVTPACELLGVSQGVREIRDRIAMVAPTTATVLITGESGTGKEVIARAIHYSSPRAHMPMVTIHCGALTETLLESELFGYEKGAFTGANSRKKGKFEVADGGTVFLDEIGDISLKTQTDLLRVLQEKEIVRVGSTQPIKVDFRCVAATNKDLGEMAKQGTFRADLFYRLNVVALRVPPLRERPEDILILAQHFLEKFAVSMNRQVPDLTASAREMLETYPWPGNVRELENAIERAMVLSRGPRIDASDLPLQKEGPVLPASASLEEVEKVHIERVVNDSRWNLSRAARILDIDRSTLYAKLKRYGLMKHNTHNA